MKIYVYGDSISLYYEPYLYELVKREKGTYIRIGGQRAGLSNGLNSGESTRELMRYISSSHLSDEESGIVLLNCGLHDIKRNRETKEINVDEKTYEMNLEKAILRFRKEGMQVIWVSTTPVIDELHNTRITEFYRFNEDVIKYNTIACNVMNRKEVPIIDLYEYVYQILDDKIFRDHVHFQNDVCEKQAAYIMKHINQLINM